MLCGLIYTGEQLANNGTAIDGGTLLGLCGRVTVRCTVSGFIIQSIYKVA